MPNWTYNRVHGSNKAVKLLLNAEGHPTFQNILPPPVELETLEKSGLSRDARVCDAIYHSFVNNDDSFLKALYTSGGYLAEQYSTEDAYVQDLKERYKDYVSAIRSLHDNHNALYDWYHWNIRNWGCKWDATDDFGPYDGTEDEIEFETPWAPPMGVMNAICEKYPDLEFTWHCDEEALFFSFDVIFQGDGTFTEVDVFPEYYIPYVCDEYSLLLNIKDLKNLSEVLKHLKLSLGEAKHTIQRTTEPDGSITLTVSVYDWDQLGGKLLYETEIGGLKDE